MITPEVVADKARKLGPMPAHIEHLLLSRFSEAICQQFEAGESVNTPAA